MRVSSRWFIGYVSPPAKPDELNPSAGQPGVVIIEATSKTSALKQAKKYLKKGAKIMGIRWVDGQGVMHETGNFQI